MASAKAFGGRLFDQVFTGDVRGCLRSSIDEASRQGSGTASPPPSHEGSGAERVAEVVHELDLVEDQPPAPKSPPDRAGDQQPPVHRPTHSEPEPRRRARWLFMGGALGAAAVVAVLALGATAISLSVADRETDRPLSGPVPDRDPVSVSVRTTPPADKNVRLDPPKSDDRPRATTGRQLAEKPLRPAEAAASLTPPPAVVEKLAPTPPAVEELAPRVVEKNPVTKVAEVIPPSKVADEPPPVTPQLRAELEAAIRRADEAEILAFSTMNAAALGGSYAGPALQKHLETMQTLAASQVFMVNRLHNQRFESFTVSPDGRRAQVRLTEVWSSNFHSRVNRQCISHVHEHDVPQTLSLELTNQGWKIYSAESHGADPQMVACHF